MSFLNSDGALEQSTQLSNVSMMQYQLIEVFYSGHSIWESTFFSL